MDRFHSLHEQLKQMLANAPPAKPPRPNSASFFVTVCLHLPLEVRERLRCDPCKGTGRQGGSMYAAHEEQPWTCPDCEGTGTRCPTCRDMRWLRTTTGPVGNRPLRPCPDCPTPAQRTATIARYIQAHELPPAAEDPAA
jgi:hypothetical protein